MTRPEIRLHRPPLINEDDVPNLTVEDWKLLYEQVTALRLYLKSRLTMTVEQRRAMDSEWRQKL